MSDCRSGASRDFNRESGRDGGRFGLLRWVGRNCEGGRLDRSSTLVHKDKELHLPPSTPGQPSRLPTLGSLLLLNKEQRGRCGYTVAFAPLESRPRAVPRSFLRHREVAFYTSRSVTAYACADIIGEWMS